MDAVFQTDRGVFNFRTAGVLIENNYILIHKDVDDISWSLPGGRVKLMEESEESLQREFLEELGMNIQSNQLYWIVENFFTYRGNRFHEIGLYYQVIAKDHHLFQEDTFYGKEGNRLIYKWVSIDELETIELEPKFLRSALKELPKHTEHLVTR